MTIGIALAVPDGIALCADTQTTWNQDIKQVKIEGQEDLADLEQPIRQPIGWSKGAKKLFPFKFGPNKAAILTAGMASIGSRSSRSVFKKLEQGSSDIDTCDNAVNYLVQGIQEELRQLHNVDDLSQAPVSAVEFVFAAFEENDITKPYLSSNIVFSGTITINNQPNTSGHYLRWTNTDPTKGRYHACWIGRTDFVAHVVNHKNKKLPPVAGQYHMMTLEDAVSYTKFLAEFTCDFQRFAVMVPDTGKPVVSAVLTPDEFRFVINAPEI